MNIVTLGLGTTPSGVILLGYHWGDTPPPTPTPTPSGGDDIEAARVFFRSRKRSQEEKARRLAELKAAIEAAEQSESTPDEAIAPVVEILEREYNLFLPSMDDLTEALAMLGRIDQQIAALNDRRLYDAAAVLLLTEL